MEYKEVNIGELIEQRLIELQLNKNDLARLIRFSPQNMNKSIFSKKSIDADKLILISKALDFDFFQYYKPVDASAVTHNAQKEISSDYEKLKEENIKLRGQVELLRDQLREYQRPYHDSYRDLDAGIVAEDKKGHVI